ncbi:MAG: glycosyltransferase family 2 protein [Sediminibacterium sp.]
METTFWIAIIIIFYTYIGYAALLYVMALFLRSFRAKKKEVLYTPSLTVIVAAYNEEACIEEKIRNSLTLVYPADLLHFIFVTDGSDDQTPGIITKYPRIRLLHAKERTGKTAAIHRAMQEVQTDIVVFTDANTILNKDALLYIGAHYLDQKTGAVAGEKRIDTSGITDAVAGEGFYWRYESMLKRSESELYSVVGAAGELFSIRTALYQSQPADTIVDDLMISMAIAAKGYRIRYEPRAYATEKASATVSEERKRKVRIAAGGIQAMVRLPFLLLPFPQPLLWFEYMSHRVLRWIITPYLLVLALVLNALLLAQQANDALRILLIVQLCFYALALAGYFFRGKQFRLRLVFLPYYFCLMNYGMIEGMLRYISGRQTVIWTKAVRR